MRATDWSSCNQGWSMIIVFTVLVANCTGSCGETIIYTGACLNIKFFWIFCSWFFFTSNLYSHLFYLFLFKFRWWCYQGCADFRLPDDCNGKKLRLGGPKFFQTYKNTWSGGLVFFKLILIFSYYGLLEIRVICRFMDKKFCFSYLG